MTYSRKRTGFSPSYYAFVSRKRCAKSISSSGMLSISAIGRNRLQRSDLSRPSV